MKTKVLKLYKVVFDSTRYLGQPAVYYACKNLIELDNATRDYNIANIEILGDVYTPINDNTSSDTLSKEIGVLQAKRYG